MALKKIIKIMLKAIGATAITATVCGGAIKMINHATEAEKAVTADYTPVIMTYHIERELFDIPEGDTSFKSYMDYRCITCADSPQYKLQQSCYTDTSGMRRTESGDYTIALGSYYANRIGDRYRIELDGGRVFYAVVGDFKADIHTDALNQYTEAGNGSKNVVEFIVDTDTLPDLTREMGDISYNGFSGNIESIERIYD